MMIRRAVGLVVCLAMIAAGAWLIVPVFTGAPRFGWFVLMGVGFIGTGIAWLWTSYIELNDD